MGPAKDDHAAVNGPEAGRQSSDDALADATDDRVFLVDTTQWSGIVLDHFQPDWNSNSILHNWWLGTVIPLVPTQNRAANRAGNVRPSIPK